MGASYREDILAASGLRDYWEFDNYSGTINHFYPVKYTDGASYGVHNSTIAQGESPIKSGDSMSMRFTGTTSSYANLHNYHNYSGLTNFTIEIWVKPTVPLASQPTAWPTIISKESFSPNGGWALFMDRATNKWCFSRHNSNGTISRLYSTGAPALNQWSLIHMRYNGAHMHLFVNGENIANMANSLSGAVYGNSLTLGKAATNSDPFIGYIDALAFYNYSMPLATATEHFIWGSKPYAKPFVDGFIME